MEEIEVIKRLEAAEGYMTLQMYDDALAEVDAALEIYPSSENCIRAKALILLSLKRYGESETWFAKLVTVKPKHVDGWIHLAYCRRRTQSLESAVETLQCALDIAPEHPLANFNMACYCAVQDQHAEALRLLEKAIQTDPQFRDLARKEKDFTSLRLLPSFQSLLSQS